MSIISQQEELRRRLAALGFDDVRFSVLAPLPTETLRPWLAAGMQGDMAWMERTAEKRLDPQLVLPGAKSVIMLGVSYWSDQLKSGGAETTPGLGTVRSEVAAPPSEKAGGNPVWARYALNEDYHDTIKPALVAAGRAIEEIFGVSGADYRYYTDTGPVLERGWAARAGLGFVGKNAMLISQRHGNWLLLAAILARVEFFPDEPVRKKTSGAAVGLLCGKCTRCLDACPTKALVAPGTLDARLCISYQTIENKGIIPRGLRAGIGARVYGCDVCLEVCPWNRFAREGRRLLLVARSELTHLGLGEILVMTPERFAEVFRRTPVKRLKLAGLLRNACVAAGNSGDTSLLPALVRLAGHESALVRAHAVWAVRQLGGDASLAETRRVEINEAVLEEYAAVAGVS